MSTNNKIVVRAIPEGRGGTFNYRNSSSHNDTTDMATAMDRIPYIGTRGVLTCVGVYFRISDTQCFVAHINGVIILGGGDERTRFCSEEEGLHFESDVVKRLTDESKLQGWSLQSDRVKESLRIVCVKPRDVTATDGQDGILAKQSGWYIVQGICEFLKIEKHEIESRVERKSGFVVDLNNDSVQMLDYVPESLDMSPHDQLHYEMTEELDSKTQDWTIKYDRKG